MSASLSRAPAVTGKERAAITGREHVRTAQVIKPSRTRLNFRSASARWLVPHQATFPGSPGSGSVEARDAAEHGTLLLGDGRRLGSTGNTASSTRSPARSPQRCRSAAGIARYGFTGIETSPPGSRRAMTTPCRSTWSAGWSWSAFLQARNGSGAADCDVAAGGAAAHLDGLASLLGPQVSGRWEAGTPRDSGERGAAVGGVGLDGGYCAFFSVCGSSPVR
jgi:hypothetical protein